MVVSIAPYADLVARVAGPEAVVETLLPAGASPHTFDPTPRDLARLEKADLVVLNGAVDAWTLELVEALGREVPVFEALAAVDADALAFRAGDAGAHAAEGEADAEGDGSPAEAHRHEDGLDPHVWLDPMLMASIVPELVAALDAVDPEGATARAVAAERLVSDLEALHAELEARLAPVAGAPFVPFHDAWPHFAARYDLDLLLEIEPFPGREPSARALAAAVDAVRATGARAVFAEAQLAARPARVLAEEAGVAVVVLDPLGGGEGTSGYEDLLRYNAERIVDALAGD